jgi:hypothetical protein
MILVHESVAKAQPFDESGCRGIILPVPGHGRLAVLVKDGEADLPRGGARRGARQARDRLDRVTAGLQTMMQLDNTKRGRGLTQHYASRRAHDGQNEWNGCRAESAQHLTRTRTKTRSTGIANF